MFGIYLNFSKCNHWLMSLLVTKHVSPPFPSLTWNLDSFPSLMSEKIWANGPFQEPNSSQVVTYMWYIRTRKSSTNFSPLFPKHPFQTINNLMNLYLACRTVPIIWIYPPSPEFRFSSRSLNKNIMSSWWWGLHPRGVEPSHLSDHVFENLTIFSHGSWWFSNLSYRGVLIFTI